MVRRMNKTYKINLENVVWGSINKKTFLIKLPTIPDIDIITAAFFRALKTNNFKLKGILELNSTGLEIWKLLIKNYNSRKILKNLIKKYPSAKKQIQTDFAKFIEQLKKNKIIDEIHQNH